MWRLTFNYDNFNSLWWCAQSAHARNGKETSAKHLYSTTTRIGGKKNLLGRCMCSCCKKCQFWIGKIWIVCWRRTRIGGKKNLLGRCMCSCCKKCQFWIGKIWIVCCLGSSTSKAGGVVGGTNIQVQLKLFLACSIPWSGWSDGRGERGSAVTICKNK